MILVSERTGVWPVARRATARDRIAVRLRASRLDRELARGEPPEATVRLALRAQHLVRPEIRRQLAGSLRRLLGAAQSPGPAALPVPVPRDLVRAASVELRELIDRLVSPAPVPARGVAMVSVLLHDGGGPLYRRSRGDDLPARVREATAALDPLAGW